MSMNFRFPISPNFSITGQPISRLISGDLPAEYHQRIELLDAVFDKFEAVHEAHEQARAIVLASQQGGPSFALYLRNFGVEEFRYSDDPTERIYDFRSAQFEEMLRKNAEQAGLAFLSLRGGNDRLDEFLGHTRPVFTGRSENWRDLVSELIAAAKVIVIVASGVSAGLFEELQVITAMGKNNRTLVFLKPEAKTLADILNQAEQPEQIETLRASFRQFTEIYETPRVDGWKPAATERKVVFGTTHHVSVAETALLAGWLLMEMGGRREAIPILQYAQSVFRDLAPENPQLAQIDAILAQLT
jgi:hypothetical protein